MEISEVRIKLVNNSKERLRAFCSITLDGAFVVRDLKIIDGANGPFVAMPSRKLSDRCHRCGYKNHLRAKFCNECGTKLKENRAPKDTQGRAKLHADVAHPINSECREQIQDAVIEAFHEEVERAKAPDYKPQDYDEYDYDYSEEEGEEEKATPSRSEKTDKGKGSFSDYDELIADLKKDAEGRRKEFSREHSRYSRLEEEDETEPTAEEDAFGEEAESEDLEESEAQPRAEEKTQEAEEDRDRKKSEATSSSEALDDDFGAGLL
jgi:stage V sporulation protein G